MNDHFKEITLKATGASELYEIEVIQNLWSGYGKIVRYGLKGSDVKSIVVKHVRLPKQSSHPRGWNTDLSHQRKVKSYEVEIDWYKNWANMCDDSCRIPHCLAVEWKGDEVLMVLEDLDNAGFPLRKTNVSWDDVNACLEWLANFHATFISETPSGLWPIGTYWHLDTRPEELSVLSDKSLKEAAPYIDKALNECSFQTFVHGDAKLANFCFSNTDKKVSAVDFQYVGGGCGMKDVAYFIGSCFHEEDCERYEGKLLDTYFNELGNAVRNRGLSLNYSNLEKEWRQMFPIAWADFHRFLKGWGPGHWKINSYSEKLTHKVVNDLLY